MVSLIHIAGFLLGCYFLYNSYIQIKEKREQVMDFLVWGIIGIALVVLSTFSQVGDFLADYLQIRTRSNTIFTLAIFILYILLFRMHTLNRKMDQNISALNEEIALLKHDLHSHTSEKEQ